MTRLALMVLSPLVLLGAPASVGPGSVPVKPLRVSAPRAPRPAAYTIDARLHPLKKQIRGKLDLRLRNSSRRPLEEVRFHLYLNAFAHSGTLFMKGSRGKMRFSRADPAEPGWIKVHEILQGANPLRGERLHDGTVLRVRLKEPVAPGEDLRLKMTFTSRLPRVFARTGHAGDFFMAGQWYPKVGFLEADGSWHCPPLHFCSEFFGPFASYSVTLQLPRQFKVGATGVLESQEQASGAEKSLRFRAVDVHDFAFAAWPLFTSRTERVCGVNVRVLSVPGRNKTARILKRVDQGLSRLQRWFGPYPYAQLTVVDVPSSALGAAGMEYPTLFTTWTPWWAPQRIRFADLTLLHELTHQYFQGMVASNEAQAPWLDEGVTSYVTGLLMDDIFGPRRSLVDLAGVRLGNRHKDWYRNLGYKPLLPVAAPASRFDSWDQYSRTTYGRAALLLRTLESLKGKEHMLEVLGQYYRAFAFHHPTTNDLHRALSRVAPGVVAGDLLDGVLHHGASLEYAIECHHGRVVARPKGRLKVPLEINLRLADDSTRIHHWDGRDLLQLKVQGLRSASLGPTDRLGLDSHPLDNACQVSPRGKLWAGLRWASVAQLLLQVLGP